jgi:hypothetical protein
MPDVSPTKWHLAHTTWFFETFILEGHNPRRAPVHPAYRYLFNSYYHAVGDRHPRPQRGMLSRPSLADVIAYRERIESEVGDLLAKDALAPELLALVELGIQHEQQHQELILTDVKHLLSCNPLRPAYLKTWPRRWARARCLGVRARKIAWRQTGGGPASHSQRGPGDHLVRIRARAHPVTHGDFARFIAEDGFRRPELWLSAGWVVSAAVARPLLGADRRRLVNFLACAEWLG